MQNSINFEIATSRAFLSDLLEEAIDNAVAKEPMEVNGVVVQLKRVEEAEIRPEGKVVNIFLPLSIHLTRAAGLFTVDNTNGNLLTKGTFTVGENAAPQLTTLNGDLNVSGAVTLSEVLNANKGIAVDTDKFPTCL